MFSKKKNKQSQSEKQLLAEAFGDLRKDLDKKEKRRKRRGWALPGWVDTRILVALGVIVVVIIGDAVRRENQEFAMVVSNLGGQVSMRPDDKQPPQPVIAEMKLTDGNVITTGATGWAELTAPDGSVVVLDSNTTMQVRLLEYHRGGQWRSRSLYLRAGRIFNRVTENFGSESELRVFTPACVAAVRGTRFAVSVDPATKETRTLCNDGAVEVRGFNGQRMFVNRTGDTTIRPGEGPALPKAAPAGELNPFRHSSLNQIVRTDPWYKQAELTITQTLDAPLTILGIGKCSWAVGAADFARRTTAMEMLRRLRANLEGDANYPLWVDPATLKELQIQEPGGVEKLLSAFDGGALESYWSDGKRFLITVRARDRKRTRYELTAAIIRESPNQN